jgi:recombination protein RecT
MYARKVALLQVLKYMPSSIELANAITVSHAAEAGQGAVIEGDFVTINSETVDQDTGEIKPPAPAPKPALPDYTDEQFAKSLPEWRGLIESGKRSAEQIIAMVSSKAVLSADQRSMIMATVVEGEAA